MKRTGIDGGKGKEIKGKGKGTYKERKGNGI